MNIDDIMQNAKTPKIDHHLGHVLDATAVLAEAIRPLGRVSSGVLYAHVCGRMSLETYEAALGMLRRAKLVSENAHVLAWIGPTPGVKP